MLEVSVLPLARLVEAGYYARGSEALYMPTVLSRPAALSLDTLWGMADWGWVHQWA